MISGRNSHDCLYDRLASWNAIMQVNESPAILDRRPKDWGVRTCTTQKERCHD
jgi:hypothetical protein